MRHDRDLLAVANPQDFGDLGGLARQQHERRGARVEVPEIVHERFEIRRRFEPAAAADDGAQLGECRGTRFAGHERSRYSRAANAA